jgi:hypothetical protein
MNCQSLRNWLLQVDSLQPKDWPAEVANHLKSCARCVKYVNALSKLEKSWREQPLPADCARAKAAFVNIVTTLAKSARPKPAVRRWHPARWGAAAAAMILIALGLVAWLALSPSEIRASEIVDQMVDWDTDLARADFAKRKPILDANEETFRKNVQSARLSAEERASAEHLFEAARKLAASDDLEEDEEILTDLAEKLLDRARTAQTKGTPKESERCNHRYSQFVEKAVTPVQTKLRIIDRLIELNMQMASADAKKRKQLFSEREEGLRQDLQAAGLSPDDQAMAEKLLEVSRRMAENDKLALQAQAIKEAADKLRIRAELAEEKGKKRESEGKKRESDKRESDRCAIGYSIFIDKAFSPFFDKLKSQSKGPPDMKKGGFDFSKFQKDFEWNRQRAGQFSRPEMHERFEEQTKKGLGRPFNKGGKRGGDR